MLTVFTPTYNRAATLPALFASLLGQTSADFEWLIVDDGSTDDTAAVVEGFREAGAPFDIRYVRKENGGKHTAVNLGATLARGDLFFIVDSDDRLLPDAVEWALEEGAAVMEDSRIAGVVGSRVDPQGRRLGFERPYGRLDVSPIDFIYVHGGGGDHAEVVKTDVIRRYPFPEFAEERFCPEGLVWRRIGENHVFRYIDRPVYVTEYLDGGLTRNVATLKMHSPRYSRLVDLETARCRRVPLGRRLKAALSYWRYCFAGGGSFAVSAAALPWAVPLALPGYLLYLRSLHRMRRKP